MKITLVLSLCALCFALPLGCRFFPSDEAQAEITELRDQLKELKNELVTGARDGSLSLDDITTAWEKIDKIEDRLVELKNSGETWMSILMGFLLGGGSTGPLAFIFGKRRNGNSVITLPAPVIHPPPGTIGDS